MCIRDRYIIKKVTISENVKLSLAAKVEIFCTVIKLFLAKYLEINAGITEFIAIKPKPERIATLVAIEYAPLNSVPWNAPRMIISLLLIRSCKMLIQRIISEDFNQTFSKLLVSDFKTSFVKLLKIKIIPIIKQNEVTNRSIPKAWKALKDLSNIVDAEKISIIIRGFKISFGRLEITGFFNPFNIPEEIKSNERLGIITEPI